MAKTIQMCIIMYKHITRM